MAEIAKFKINNIKWTTKETVGNICQPCFCCPFSSQFGQKLLNRRNLLKTIKIN